MLIGSSIINQLESFSSSSISYLGVRGWSELPHKHNKMKLKLCNLLQNFSFNRVIIQVPGNSLFPGILKDGHYHFLRDEINLNYLITFISEFSQFIRNSASNNVKIEVILPLIRRWKQKICDKCLPYKQGPRKLRQVFSKLKPLKNEGITVIDIRKPVQRFFKLEHEQSIIKSSIILYRHFVGKDGVHLRNDNISHFHEFLLQL